MQTKPPRISTILLIGVLGTTTLTCKMLTVPSQATPTPTGQINAIEAGATASPADKKDWQVWSGTITSKTSRQFTSNGSVVNTCETDWSTDFMATVDPVGDVNGIGLSTLTAGPNCAPHGISGNTTEMTISVKGRKDQNAFYLNFGIAAFKPMPSGDFGGYTLLITNGACPPIMQTLTIPISGSTSAQAQLDLSATMTGCAGSKDDRVSNQSQVEIHYLFKCDDDPLKGNDPKVDPLCQ